MRSSMRCCAAVTNSAAADGVGARRSATKSAMVKSVSWPMAETTGSSEAAMARASPSSLKHGEIFQRPTATGEDDEIHRAVSH